MILSASSSSSSSPISSPSYLVPRSENVACSTPLKGLHRNLSSTLTEAASMLSTRRPPLDSSLRL